VFVNNETSVNIRFWIRKANSKIVSTNTIICRITVNGIRVNFSTKIKVEAKFWNAKAQKIMRNTQEAKTHNLMLESMRNQIKKHWLELENKGELVTAEKLKDLYFGIDSSNFTFLEVYEKFYEYSQNKLAEGSLKNYRTYIKNFSNFLSLRKKKNILVSELKPSLLDDYIEWQTFQIGNSINYIAKQINIFKACLNYAVRKEWIKNNPFEVISLKRENNHIIHFLEWEELKVAENLSFASEKLQKQVDCFIFQCYTGLAYNELKNFQDINIQKTQDRLWIMGFRGKTKNKFELPFLAKAQQIYNKYQGRIPVISNQKYNQYLREAFEIAGLEVGHITSHTARRTFANLALNHWQVSLETVSKMLGHNDIRTTKRYYVEIQRERIAKEMEDIK